MFSRIYIPTATFIVVLYIMDILPNIYPAESIDKIWAFFANLIPSVSSISDNVDKLGENVSEGLAFLYKCLVLN